MEQAKDKSETARVFGLRPAGSWQVLLLIALAYPIGILGVLVFNNYIPENWKTISVVVALAVAILSTTVFSTLLLIKGWQLGKKQGRGVFFIIASISLLMFALTCLMVSFWWSLID